MLSTPRSRTFSSAAVGVAALAATLSFAAPASAAPAEPGLAPQNVSRGATFTKDTPMPSEAQLVKAGAVPGSTPTLKVSATKKASGKATQSRLDFTQQVQQKSNWCWAATSTSIVRFKGVAANQNDFCKAAHPTSAADCANEPGTNRDIMKGLAHYGFRSRTTSPLPISGVRSNIDASRPILSMISWNSGEAIGHAQVLYGYSGDNVNYSDPWPDSARYSTASYSTYLRNTQWTARAYVSDIAR